MARFAIRYYFGKDDFIEDQLEADTIEDARHLAFLRYKPSKNDTEFEVRSGDVILVGVRDAVRYYTISPADESTGGG